MFNFLIPKPDIEQQSTLIYQDKSLLWSRQRLSFLVKSTVTGTLLSSALLLSGCQPSTSDSDKSDDTQTTEQARMEAETPAPMSDSAAARIEQFQPLYVTQMQSLQRRLQAEYESLKAADMPNSADVSLLADTDTDANNTAVEPATNNDEATINVTDTDDDIDTEVNTSTEVGERDLQVLKRISLEPREPEILDEAQITERYQQAMQALYAPAVTLLSAEQTDTLLNIATLLPQLFEHAQIAERVNIKSPALARLIIQHQVWQQIEVQQALDMQQMKLTQKQEFEGLMTKFNDTIKDYDEQIAKYEKTLKEFR